MREASFPADLPLVRQLFEEYAAGVGVDLSFQGFANELAGLPGKYVPPRGGLWIAEVGGTGSAEATCAGCIALRQLSEADGEIKRLYVRDAFRGQGIGRTLTEHVLQAAVAMGYTRFCLDTLPSMAGAIALYHSLGFTEMEPYCHNPIPGAIFLTKTLRA